MKIRYVCVLFDQMYTCMSICAPFYKQILLLLVVVVVV